MVTAAQSIRRSLNKTSCKSLISNSERQEKTQTPQHGKTHALRVFGGILPETEPFESDTVCSCFNSMFKWMFFPFRSSQDSSGMQEKVRNNVCTVFCTCSNKILV